MTRADDILVARAEADFEDGLKHTRAEMRRKHGLLAGATLDGLVMTAVTGLGMRSRMKEDVRHLIAVAHRVANGEDPEILADEHLAHVLRLKSQMAIIAREDDPEFQHIKKVARDLFAKRLPDLAKMVVVTGPRDYADLVRQAFPERAYVDAMVEENATAVAAIVDHLEKHPHILRMPGGFVPKVAQMAREMVVWKTADVKRGVAEIYDGPR